MNTVDVTRPSLLMRIRNPRDEVAWGEFARLYSPLIYRFARGSGLQTADAELVTSDVLMTVARSIHRFDYDPKNGSFRGWLKVVTRSRLSDFMRSNDRHLPGSGDTGVHHAISQQADPSDEQRWERDYRRSLFEWAANRIENDFEATTWQAFWQTSVDGRKTTVVAEELGLSVGAVYIARSRVLARLRREVQDADI